eukprot:SAG25_NODE_11312_length_307_cov_1.134615_1_plen_36_part_01
MFGPYKSEWTAQRRSPPIRSQESAVDQTGCVYELWI